MSEMLDADPMRRDYGAPVAWLRQWLRRRDSTAAAVLAGLIGVLLSLALGSALRAGTGGGEPLIAVFPVVLTTCLLWGLWAGGLSLVGGLVGAWYVYVGRPFSFEVSLPQAYGLVAAVGVGIFVLGVCLLLRATILALHDANAQAQLMSHELAHRMKNTLAVVAVIARRTYRDAGTKTVHGDFLARLSALAHATTTMLQTPDQSVDLEQLVVASLAPFGHDAEPERFEMRGPPLHLERRAVVAFSLALHELATNAIKYGALSGPEGKVSVRWSLSPGPTGRLRLDWVESGGPPVSEPAARGFGSQLIERNLAETVDGVATLIFARDGLRAEIIVPGRWATAG